MKYNKFANVLFSILAILVLATGAQAVLTASIDSATTDPNAIVNLNLTVTANVFGETIDSFTPVLSLTSGSRVFNITGTQVDSFSLAADETLVITLPFTVYNDQFAGTYTGTIDIVGNVTSTSASPAITVNDNADLNLAQESVSGVEGETANLNLSFINTGNKDMNVAFSITNLTLGTYAIDVNHANTVSLDYKETESKTIPVLIPSDLPAGVYTGLVQTVYDGISENFTISLTVEDAVESFTAPTGINFNVINSGTYQAVFEVTNNGNVELSNIQLTDSDLTNGTAYIGMSLSPTLMTLAPGDSENVTLTIVLTGQVGTFTGNISTTFGNQTKTTPVTLNSRTPVTSVALPNPIDLPSASRGNTFTHTFDVTNDGDVTLTGIVLDTTGLNTEFNITLQNAPTSLTAGASATVTINGAVPRDAQSGDVLLGALKFTSSQYNESTNVYANVESEMKVTIRYKVDGSSYSTLADGEKASKKAVPGSEVKLELKVENEYNEDIEIQDIEIIATLKDIDDGDDIEEELDTFDVRDGRSKTETVTFDIPWEVEARTYDVEINVEGEDEEGINHQVEKTIQFEVKKETHDLYFDRAEFQYDTVECGQEAQLDVRILDTGDKDEDEGRVTIQNTQLGINIVQDFEVQSGAFDNDNEYQRTFDFLIPADMTPGSYQVSIKAYYDTTRLDKTETRILKVTCDGTTPTPIPTPTPNPNPNPTPNPNPIQNNTQQVLPLYNGSAYPVDSVEYSIRDSDYYTTLLIVVNVVVVIILILLIAKLLSPRR